MKQEAIRRFVRSLFDGPLGGNRRPARKWLSLCSVSPNEVASSEQLHALPFRVADSPLSRRLCRFVVPIKWQVSGGSAIGCLKRCADQRGVFGNLDVDALRSDNARAGGPLLEAVLLRAANAPVGRVHANRQTEGEAVAPALRLWREDGEIAPDIEIDRPADDVAAEKRRIAARCQRYVSGGGDGGIRQRLVIAFRLADIEADRGQGKLQAAS